MENSIDNIAGSPYTSEIPLHHIHLVNSNVRETIAAEGSCIKRCKPSHGNSINNTML